MYFKFDANFNRLDESGIRSQYVGQNVSQLRKSIDSIGRQVDSIGDNYAAELLTARYAGVSAYSMERPRGGGVPRPVSSNRIKAARQPDVARAAAAIDIDSIFSKPTPSMAKSYVSQALSDARRSRQDFEYRALMLTEQAKLMRRHDIEMQRKFTLSFAVLVFFFIGAPLGAIIKKGGLGTPLVISVLLFIVYYIFDNTGYKMARDGKLEVWQGMWLSTVALLPLGIFFTRKAVDDSAVFNADAYRTALMRLVGRQPKRSLELKEIVMEEVDPAVARALLSDIIALCSERPKGYRRRLTQALNDTVEHLANSRDPMVIALLNELPFTPTRRNTPGIKTTSEKLLTRFNDTDHGQQ